LELWQDHISSDDNRVTEFLKDDELHLLSVAMEKLSDEKREILLLSKYQEMKYKEIGEVLGCTEGAVKVKVFRALQALKAVYVQLEKQM
jgi:RNA polymerase sigma-70 factor (ECF subfamily)